jgi:hypothetical protein
MRERLRGVDRNDPGMRAVGAQEVCIKLAGRVPVGRVPAAAGDEADILYPAAVMMVCRVGVHDVCFPLPKCRMRPRRAAARPAARRVVFIGFRGARRR